MIKLRIIGFWCVVFFTICKETIKGNTWHSVIVDYDIGLDEQVHQKRKRLVARRSSNQFYIDVQE